MKPEIDTLVCKGLSGVAGGTAYSVYGSGAPVVLIHGVGMEQAAWTAQVEALAAGYQLVVYDMFGHGKSRVPPEGVTLADYADQLSDLLDHLGIAAANVIGHSMGALVALEFALGRPHRTTRVAALNAVFMRTPEQKAAVMARAAALKDVGVSATVDATIARWFGTPVPDALRASARMIAGILANVNAVGYARTYQLFATCDSVHADRLASLEMPALFMTAEFDLNSSPAMSAEMARRAPQGELSVIPGARHMMNVTDPQEVNRQLRSFLEAPAQPRRQPDTAAQPTART
ncbi:MAG: alpha/beta fold hydrolase [Pseudomonadota bacterium]